MNVVQPSISEIKQIIQDTFSKTGYSYNNLISAAEPELIDKFKLSKQEARSILKGLKVAIYCDSSLANSRR